MRNKTARRHKREVRRQGKVILRMERERMEMRQTMRLMSQENGRLRELLHEERARG